MSANASRQALETPKEQMLAIELLQLYGSYVDAEMSGQAIEAERFKNAISQQFNLLPSGLQFTDVIMLQMLQTQNQILTRQAFLQNSVQALITQNYELLEYPIPRLFVVLPKPKQLRDKFKLATSFRLYFLCDCGEHTATPGTCIPHDIHLAKHEGYEVDQSNRFFEKYGSYVLTIMRALRLGVTVAGVAMPPLLHVAEGINSFEKIIGVAAKEVGSLMDETIRYIKDHGRNSKGFVDATSPGTELDTVEALEGADLRELQSYLSTKDEGHDLGNLYRIVTLEGHVKWVCLDHYRENYRQISMQRLKDVVKSNHGGFKHKESSIFIVLKTNTLAKQFYDALVKSHGVRILNITLAWDASMNDLQTLVSAVNQANISKITIFGEHFNGPTLDFVNNSRRYDPIIQLMCNSRIHSMTLRYFKTFTQHIRSLSIQTTSQLKELYLDVGPFLADKSSRSLFKKLLRYCPSLTVLKMYGVDLSKGFGILESKTFAFRNMVVMTLIKPGSQLDVRLLHDKILSVRMSVDDPAYLSVDEKALVVKGTLTELSIKNNAPSTEPELSDLLRNNQALAKLRLFCACPRPVIVDWIANARKECLSRNGTSSLRETEVVVDGGLVITLTFHDNSNAPVISSVFKYWGLHVSLGGLGEMLDAFSWTIYRAELKCYTKDDVVLLLHKAMKEKGSRLTNLCLNPQSLTSIGVDCVCEIIKISENLNFCLDISNEDDPLDTIEEEYDVDIVEVCLRRFGPTLHGLMVGGFYGHVPVRVVIDKVSTRFDMPKLETLGVYFSERENVTNLEMIRWIISMAAVPPCQAGALSRSQNDILLWTPLKTLELYMDLDTEEWSTVLKALDYSTLEDLDLGDSAFGEKELEIFLEFIPTDASLAIDLRDTSLKRNTNVDALLSRIQMKAPDVTVFIDSED
ncbi:hypothetical protein BGZ99_009948, partial [Dissophora globulifera]